ncbi:MAG: LPS export ABC transporter periplasmic protein LptC [Alphaproteobacteria bacterium]|nr:LPS export ABC transporter periplasmic protein LptC [Alphaproteobacteria bacterium]
MQQDKRNFIIFSKHKRLKRLWQFFFTGWGLVMVAALVAGSLFTKQILWTPISAINMTEIVSNQFKMSGASFVGTDKDGNPFKLRAQNGYQEYDNPNIIYMDSVSGSLSRAVNNTHITDNISAKHGQFNRTNKTIKLIGNVRVDSSNGDKVRTNELVIKL